MQKIYIAGVGQTPVRENWEKSLKELAGDAALSALEDANLGYPEGIFVGNMMSGSANHQLQLGALLADWLGMHYREGFGLESACSSGAAAFRAALMAIASGELSSALVIGVEKMTDSPLAEITANLATAADADLEGDFGVSFVALNALIMQRYMYEYGWKTSDFAAFSINAHANAVFNPNARFRKAISLSDYEHTGMVCEPINLLDASPVSDGAAALYLTAAPPTKDRRISVAASSAATDTISLQNRTNSLRLSAAEKSARIAYQQAGITPREIGLFEYHDAFSIMAALSLEAAGFCEPGQGPRLANDGSIAIDGAIPVATMGGLKARGHPVGATGLYQLVEVALQLRGEAGQTQIEAARWGMAQNIGGSGSNIITHILHQG
ncbi:MAG: thiolase domain-containing protein [Chloroflexi bacterium]|nr:thiolase domain-containing protein [Chloroflexota bacterium]